MNDLKDTVELMLSDDYKDRFKAEYFQAKIRYEKLHKTVVKYEAGTLSFKPACSIDVLKSQLKALREYIYCLSFRAEIEHIDLD